MAKTAESVDPDEILIDVEDLAEAPPEEANYREADIDGVACANCAHFRSIGDAEPDNDWLRPGACELYEAKIQEDMVCSKFTADSALIPSEDDGEFSTDKEEDDAAKVILAEMFLSGDTAEVQEEDNLVWKTILRTGEWDITPGANGLAGKKLTVIRDGESDPSTGTVSLSDLKESFGNAFDKVTIPLGVKKGGDHENITRNNTGFTRKLKLVDGDDGVTRLQAALDFTEPEVKEKALRGTYADCSSGIYFNWMNRAGKRFRAALNHVALTNTPVIDGMEPFGVKLSDDGKLEVEMASFSLADSDTSTGRDDADQHPTTGEKTDEGRPFDPRQSVSWQRAAVSEALQTALALSSEYSLVDITSNQKAVISHSGSETTWVAGFSLGEDCVVLSKTEDWVDQDDYVAPEGETEETNSSQDNQGRVDLAETDPLKQAQRMREDRLPQPQQTGGQAMGKLSDSLGTLELSDEQREAIQLAEQAQDENAELKRGNKMSTVDQKIDKLKELGLSDEPGVLKFIRQVYISDDDGPAVVLLSEEGEPTGTKLSASEVIDKLIDGFEKTEDGKLLLSRQGVDTGNDDKPAADAEGEQDPLEDRVASAKEALHGSKKKRRGRSAEGGDE